MSRSLRPRPSRPNYVATIDLGSDEDRILPHDGDASSDDYEPANQGGEEPEVVESDGIDDLNNEDDEVVVMPTKKSKKPKVKGRLLNHEVVPLPRKAAKKASNVNRDGPSFSRPSNRQHYALPMPNQDHRYRSKALYQSTARVERLVEPPRPFEDAATIPTNNWTMSELITDRYNKASGYNVGPGPVWEFMEDRSWWKESRHVETGAMETESTRRPKVYRDVKVHEGSEIVNVMSAQTYLPVRYDENGLLSSTFKCSFGPIESQTQRDIKMFESIKMSEWYEDSKAHVFNAGGPVWSLDWCPTHAEDRPYRFHKLYLALAPFPSNKHSPNIGVKCTTPSPACVQIWSFGPMFEEGKNTSSDGFSGDVECELVICIDCGPAYDLKWCPLPSHDRWDTSKKSHPRKLGILAGTFEDGSLSIFVVPDPADLRKNGGPVYVKLEPRVKLLLDDTCFWSLDWANSDRIAIGCTNGFVAVYDVKDALLSGESDSMELLPVCYIPVHQSAIRAIQWVRAPPVSADGSLRTEKSPTIIISGGFDGCEVFTDIREQSGNVANRTRDVVHSMSYSLYTVGMVTIDHENIVKTYALNPMMLSRGHLLAEAMGPVWSIHCSDYHPHLAVASADGSVFTTNTLKSTRRSASTPFLSYKIFQMDYNRKTGEYRMLDQFKPHEFFDKIAQKRPSGKKRNVDIVQEDGTGVWPEEVSATCVSWNNGSGLARAPLLCSATASGLCRIDWLTGMFLRDRQPYGGIQSVRGEIDVEMEEDEDE